MTPATQLAQPPRLPLAVRAANTAAGIVRRAGVEFVRLDPERLIETATRATGLHDFGADPFLDPMRLLVESLEGDAALSLLGRSIAKRELLRLLTNRL